MLPMHEPRVLVPRVTLAISIGVALANFCEVLEVKGVG